MLAIVRQEVRNGETRLSCDAKKVEVEMMKDEQM